MNQLHIHLWENRGESDNDIVLLPYTEGHAHIARDLLGIRIAALIPPYHDAHHEFTARSAVMARGDYPNHRIMVPIRATTRQEAKRLLVGFQRDGFDAFALPEFLSEAATVSIAGFWNSSRILRDDCWYHVAGGEGVAPAASVAGKWTWSPEEL